MKIHVRYFAALREALGPDELVEAVEGTTLGGLRDALLARGGRHAEALSRQRALRCAHDQTMSDESTP
jgi:molybdopterin synthase sulfur carrier subunit